MPYNSVVVRGGNGGFSCCGRGKWWFSCYAGKVGEFSCERRKWAGSAVVTGRGGWVHPKCKNGMAMSGVVLGWLEAGGPCLLY